ncbi:ERF family protein [Sphingomonas sp.]|uniref:ERF family protein n=1 Tax=Sphingomonas sp. TaxID=28214 RepID=UPI0031E0860B
MNAVAQREEQGGEVAVYGDNILAVIERAARDPNTDIDKLERLFALRERIEERAAKQAFTEAKLAMRPELPEIGMKGQLIIRDKKDANVIVQETPFARFEDLQDAVMPVLTKHCFDLKFSNGLAPDGKVRVTTILAHVAGHEDSTHFDLPHDSSGSKNAVQAIGSSTKYGMRYGTIAILNIKVVGSDDDGVSAMPETVVEKPIETVRDQPFPQGPAKNKTELKTIARQLWRNVESCADDDQLNALLADDESKEIIAQLKEALPSWWDGYEKDGQQHEGLGGVITRVQTEIAGGLR